MAYTVVKAEEISAGEDPIYAIRFLSKLGGDPVTGLRVWLESRSDPAFENMSRYEATNAAETYGGAVVEESRIDVLLEERWRLEPSGAGLER